MSTHFMNPARGKHMSQDSGTDAGAVSGESEQHHAPHIHVHPHTKGVTVHVMHHDGTHTKHEHAHGDADGIAAHIHKHIGGAAGQDHGEGDGQLGEEAGAS